MKIIEKIEQEQLKKETPIFKVGDTVKVHTRVREGEKERIQVFSGIVIARQGSGLNEAFTVRRISYGEGVERVFPVQSPLVEKVEVDQSGRVRRSKLYYLRHKKGDMAVKRKDTRPNNTRLLNQEQMKRIAAATGTTTGSKKSKKKKKK